MIVCSKKQSFGHVTNFRHTMVIHSKPKTKAIHTPSAASEILFKLNFNLHSKTQILIHPNKDKYILKTKYTMAGSSLLHTFTHKLNKTRFTAHIIYSALHTHKIKNAY